MINLEIITPRGLYRIIETTIINVTSKDGERGILPNHVPVTFMLDIGKLETEEDGVRKEYAIVGGIFYFENKHAKMLVDSIEAKEEIDVERALASKQRQLDKLNNKDTNIDIKRAEVALKRALNRIKIAG